MPFEATVFRVLIASPSDTTQSRASVLEAIVEWNDLNAEGYQAILLPIMWEMSATPSVGRSPQAILNDQIVDDADVVVAIFWTRLGTPTDSEPSGSVEEIRRKADQAAPVLLYFSSQPADMHTVDPVQLQALQEFRSSMEDIALVGTFETNQGLSHTVQRDLTRVIRDLHSPTSPASPESDTDLAPIGPASQLLLNVESDTVRIIEAYKGDLRGAIARRRIELEGALAQQDPEAGRRSMTGLASDLSQLVGVIASMSPQAAASPLSARLGQLAQQAHSLGQLRMYLDGGTSWNTLATGSLQVLADATELVAIDWVQLMIPTP